MAPFRKPPLKGLDVMLDKALRCNLVESVVRLTPRGIADIENKLSHVAVVEQTERFCAGGEIFPALSLIIFDYHCNGVELSLSRSNRTQKSSALSAM